jgi:hypothetical protein
VAKLLARYLGEDRPREAYFVFRGVVDQHRDPVEAVLERHGLAAVAESGGRCELLGIRSGIETRVWTIIEERGGLAPGLISTLFPEPREQETLAGLVRRRLVFRSVGGDFHALSRLMGGLAPR